MHDLASVMLPARKLNEAEVIRAIREMVAAEYDAVRQYTQLAESVDNKFVQAVLEDISREELVHAGEFLRLLNEIAPDEQGFYNQGASEVEDMMKGSG